MQMYFFTVPSPHRDGCLDADVFIHEKTHGTSNRLHNNGSDLNDVSKHAAWAKAGRIITPARSVDGQRGCERRLCLRRLRYAICSSPTFTDNYYYGIRRFPYAVKTNVGANGKPH